MLFTGQGGVIHQTKHEDDEEDDGANSFDELDDDETMVAAYVGMICARCGILNCVS